MKRVLLLLVSIGFLSFVLFLMFGKPTSITIESQLGTFCLKCKTFESGSGIGAYGFGLAFCDDKIVEMSNTVNYDEINKFRQYLKANGFVEIANKVSQIEHYLKAENTEKYVDAVQEYTSEIERLNSVEKENLLAFLKN